MTLIVQPNCYYQVFGPVSRIHISKRYLWLQSLIQRSYNRGCSLQAEPCKSVHICVIALFSLFLFMMHDVTHL